MATIGLTIAVPDRTGAARMALSFAEGLLRRGHRVVVIHGPAPTDGSGEEMSILPDMQRAGAELRPVPRLRRPLPPLIGRDLRSAAHDCDLLVGVNQRDRAAAVQAAHRLGVPAAVAVQNQHRFNGLGPLKSAKRRLYRRTMATKADLLICTSEVVRGEVVEMGVTPERTAVLANGIPIGAAPTEPDDLRTERGIDPAAALFVMVGRLDRQKGQDLLLDAFHRVLAQAERPGRPPPHLALIGDVSEGNAAADSRRFKAELEQAIDRHELAGRVSLVGWSDEVDRWLAAADVYVHAARWEGWPLSVVEAMAAARPVVLSDCAGRPHGFVDGRHGFVVPTGDVEALAHAMTQTLHRSDDELRAMGRSARELAVAHYDIDSVSRRFAELLESLLEGPGDPAPTALPATEWLSPARQPRATQSGR